MTSGQLKGITAIVQGRNKALRLRAVRICLAVATAAWQPDHFQHELGKGNVEYFVDPKHFWKFVASVRRHGNLTQRSLVW